MSNWKSMAGVTGAYRVTLTGEEPVEVTLIAADIMRYEQVNAKSFFSGDVSLSRIAWVVWAAMRRTKRTDLEVAEFLARVEDIESEDDGAEEDEDDGVQLPDPTAEAFTG